ncbi:hypothetical protein FPOAC1_007472 [Fusarium poae]|uniref:hypothetical protein n=1 Tax=Fusarium poae TaxID=36050 RepID=UPI001CE874C5|nr:hypothetical protein FPOAC1_007472 [Fusarium poae]KAG8668104.1 hypothetical protein FPOAC1_007472 [Fusarium poae]
MVSWPHLGGLAFALSHLVDSALGDEHKSNYTAPWETLPPTPQLPEPNFNGTVPINGIDLWYATFGASLECSKLKGLFPVVFLHGGYANSDYYAHQIRHLRDGPYTLIAIDSRSQGRSGDDPSKPLAYDQMTEDVVALMDHLEIERFSTVGWSDGGIISFDLAMNFTSRVDRIFSFGGSYSPTNINATIGDSPVFSEYLERVAVEYKHNTPSNTPFEQASKKLDEMWATQPVWDAQSFAKIPSRYDVDEAPIIWIVDGDSEEAVTRDTPGTLRSWIWGSDLVILPGVSHFATLVLSTLCWTDS